MRVDNERQLTRPWRIHALATDFTLEDVWELPAVAGGRNAFDTVVEMAAGFDPAHADSRPTRVLWGFRDLLGRLFGLGRISAAGATAAASLADRLPADLRGTADAVRFAHGPFVPLYRTLDEFAAEMSNRTVHGVMHLAWLPDGGDRYHLQLAVYVKPRGLFGRGYMQLIKPFRYLIVYPALESQFARAFAERSRR